MDPQAQLDALKRGVVATTTEAELLARLGRAAKTGRPLRVKLGVDPTAPDIHLGHTVVLRKLRQFQDLGHRAVLLIGDFTALIGDPSGREKTRPPLTPDAIEANAKTYLDQAGKVLDLSPERLEVVRNGAWLRPLLFEKLLGLAAQVTVARFLERDDFSERYQKGAPIGLHEFLYPVMQGYDSVEVRADVELGGTDQTFNLLVGRDLQRAHGQEPQATMTLPILVGLDGVRKMSKSYGNHIGVAEDANSQYGKAMSIPDAAMKDWFTLLTDIPLEEAAALLDSAKTHPRAAKDRLAREIVSAYHGAAAAREASARFEKVHVRKIPATKLSESDFTERVVVTIHFEGDSVEVVRHKGSTMERVTLSKPESHAFCDPKGVLLPNLLKELDYAPSTSSARAFIFQGAVKVNDQKVIHVGERLIPGSYCLEVGKQGIVSRVDIRREP